MTTTATDTANPEIGERIDVNGIGTNYIVAGEGEPLILIHGSGPGVTAYANWRGVIPDLAKSFRCYAPDTLGFGYTDFPADIQGFDMDRWIAHLTGFMDALGIESAHFIGNSYGGALTLALAARHPERVRRAVLMGAAGVPFDVTEGLKKVWGYEPSVDAMRDLMNTFAFDSSLVKEEIVRSRFEASVRPGAHEAYSSLFPEPRQRWLDALASSEADLKALPHEIIAIHGREDVIVPFEVSLRFSQLIPNCELHIFGNCGHWTQIEKRDRFIALVTPFLHGA
ncbi:alpha/beta fold hydrolase [Novosphingobium colocasiae]|uniref:2,6-dioxo-6-phenylhexa-3-enoate hydrolase n=1 Tax=Novosphingobium colocasiae TaxID=1256513 RepID=A0A918P8R1_9SPHN|nr:alpha/beta hydrolase [Novosphingobium colocasiae]GGY90333.1 2,6-dioxo-6-phenylhexa-3-enoate hydrolase [Novosphingobium colocasiae]